KDLVRAVTCYDVVCFYRTGLTPWVNEAVKEANKHGVRLAFDVDDRIFDPDQLQDIPYLGGFSVEAKKVFLNESSLLLDLFNECDFFIGSTPALAAEAQSKGKASFCLRNSLNSYQVGIARWIEEKGLRAAPKEVFRIGYFSGSNTHDRDFSVAAAPLTRTLKKHPYVKLLVCGHVKLPDSLKPYSTQIDQLPWVEEKWFPFVKSLADLNVSPLDDPNNAFQRCKSEVKLIESAVFGIPSVCTPLQAYKDFLGSDLRGFAATSTEEWETQLERLVADKDYYRSASMRFKARAHAYFPESTAGEVAAVFREIASRPKVARNSTPSAANVPTHVAAGGTDLEERPFWTDWIWEKVSFDKIARENPVVYRLLFAGAVPDVERPTEQHTTLHFGAATGTFAVQKTRILSRFDRLGIRHIAAARESDGLRIRCFHSDTVRTFFFPLSGGGLREGSMDWSFRPAFTMVCELFHVSSIVLHSDAPAWPELAKIAAELNLSIAIDQAARNLTNDPGIQIKSSDASDISLDCCGSLTLRDCDKEKPLKTLAVCSNDSTALLYQAIENAGLAVDLLNESSLHAVLPSREWDLAILVFDRKTGIPDCIYGLEGIGVPILAVSIGRSQSGAEKTTFGWLIDDKAQLEGTKEFLLQLKSEPLMIREALIRNKMFCRKALRNRQPEPKRKFLPDQLLKTQNAVSCD
ncbi:MAG: hypothetical protein C5B49_02760, partial [Bdellovibrio sp.]